MGYRLNRLHGPFFHGSAKTFADLDWHLALIGELWRGMYVEAYDFLKSKIEGSGPSLWPLRLFGWQNRSHRLLKLKPLDSQIKISPSTFCAYLDCRRQRWPITLH